MAHLNLEVASSLTDDRFDGVVLVTDDVNNLSGTLTPLIPVVKDYIQVNIHCSGTHFVRQCVCRDGLVQRWATCGPWAPVASYSFFGGPLTAAL